MSMLKGSRFEPSRGGHAPGDVRDAFQEAVESWADWEPETKPEPVVDLRDKPTPITAVINLLWNCTDIMPSDLCDCADMPAGSTYAQGARQMSRAVQDTYKQVN